MRGLQLVHDEISHRFHAFARPGGEKHPIEIEVKLRGEQRRDHRRHHQQVQEEPRENLAVEGQAQAHGHRCRKKREAASALIPPQDR
jgi:hypothetical protein